MLKQKVQDDLSQHTPEKLLLDTVLRLARYRAERRAVHVHLSRLKRFSRRDLHIRIAVNTFETLVKQFDGAIFLLGNSDLVFVCKGARVDLIEEALTRVRYLFNEDPLVHEVNDEQSGGFCTWYNLERDYDAFLRAAQTLYEGEKGRAPRVGAIAREAKPAQERRGMDGRQLGKLVDAIQGADLSSLLRRQPVAALLPGVAPQVVFRELYISIADLRDMVMPGYELAADRWLFQHLTHTLDRRMLKLLLKSDDGFLHTAFSVNMNVATLLSEDFLQFDASLRSGARGTIVLELQLFDIFADLAAFSFARSYAKERHYRILLDGINHHTLPHVDPLKLGLDFVKVTWRPEMADLDGDPLSELKGCVERIGKARAILCHVDSEEAIAFGRRAGFALFQGRHVDGLIAQHERRAGPPGRAKPPAR